VAAVPEVTAASAGSAGQSATIIALSSAPAPPSPTVEVLNGNLAARVAISPEGKGNGSGGGSATPNATGNGSSSASGDPSAKSSVGISISGGNPKPNAGVSGLGAGKLTLPKASSIYKRPDPKSDDDPPERSGPPDFASIPPGTAPEQVFGSHRVYSMNIDMPDLSTFTGSWIIHFSELHQQGLPRTVGTLSAPDPVRKVDPKYPQDLVQEHVQGEVILYGVIRTDGSVDGIQLVRGVDKTLDANSIAAFGQWKFHPATKDGQAVPVEAIIHIPFHEPPRQ
jgi:TonB family protein